MADVGKTIDALIELVDADHAASVVALVEHAHRLADAAIEYADDSDGCLTGVDDQDQPPAPHAELAPPRDRDERPSWTAQ